MVISLKTYIQSRAMEFEVLKNKKILSAVSGGVDSTTSSVLLKSLGLRVDCLFIDTGYLRNGEVKEVTNSLKKVGLSLRVIDRKQYFYNLLKDVVGHKEKREAFRNVYFQVLKKYLKDNKYEYLVQGTQFAQIGFKGRNSHNHATRDFLKSGIRVIEPVKGLKKNEVRVLAKALGLPRMIVDRMPFPGPGLLIRFSGSFTRAKLKTIRTATKIVEEYFSMRKNSCAKIYQIVVFLVDEPKVPFINRRGNGEYGNILLIKILTESYEKKQIQYKPVPISASEIEGLTDDLLRIGGIARVCWDLTPKRGCGVNVMSGGTIEYI